MALHAKKFISFVKWELTSCLGNRDLRTLLRVGTEAVGAFSMKKSSTHNSFENEPKLRKQV